LNLRRASDAVSGLSADGEGALKVRAPDGTVAEVVVPGRYNEK